MRSWSNFGSAAMTAPLSGHDAIEYCELLFLPRRREGERLEPFEPFGQLVGGETDRTQTLDHGGEFQLGSRYQHHTGTHALAEPFVGQSDDRHPFDLGEVEQQILDLARGDVQAASDDDL